MQIRWLRRALRDLHDIGKFIAQGNAVAARQTVAGIGLLPDQPALGSRGRVPGMRELAIPGPPFIVPYRARGGAIEILRVLHTARQWPMRFSVQEQQVAYGAPVGRPTSRRRGRTPAGGTARGAASQKVR
jgi:plasmid stabilization system protein ParE